MVHSFGPPHLTLVRFEFGQRIPVLGEGLSDASVALAVVVALVVLGWMAVPILTWILRRLSRVTRTSLDDKLTKGLRPLLRVATVLLALRIAPRLTSLLLGDELITDRYGQMMDNVVYVGWALLTAMAIMRVSTAVLDWYAHEIVHRDDKVIDKQILPFARRVIFVLVYAVAGVTILGRLGVDISAMVATLGVGSLAVALAAQSALSDTISGVLIMLDRPFRIGDRIEVLEIESWGDVEDIGLRSTRIRTLDNRQVIIPNSAISTNLVINYSLPSDELRVETHVGVAYGSDLGQVRSVMLDTVAAQDWVMTERRIEALLMEMADSALVFRVRCWIANYAEARRAVDKLNSCLYEALGEAGIEIPYPQLVTHPARPPDARSSSDAAREEP